MAAFIAILVLLFGLLCLELGYRLFLLALFWLAPFWCAIAAAYFVVSLHLSDPLAPLWAFMAAAFCGRLLMGRARNWLFARLNAF